MRLNLSTIGDIGLQFLDHKYVVPPWPMSMDHMVDIMNQNIVMIDITSSLNYSKFDEVKDGPTAYDMWKKLHSISRGDENMKRAKVESLRG